MGHLSAGESHPFTMKLYASYMSKEAPSMQIYPGMNPMLAMSLSMANNGWGELVDRIISGSNKGVAINPRAEKLYISVKEVNQESFSNGIGTFNAIDLVKTMAYNPLEEAYCRIYFRLIKCHGIDTSYVDKDNQFVTVEMSTNSKLLKFSKGTNEVAKSTWQFISAGPDETIHETIQITGLSPTPTNENDFLYFDVFSSGRFVGSGKYSLRSYNQISDTGIFGKKVKNIDLFLPGSNTPVGSVEIDLEYTGKNYNVDTYVEMILNWRSIFEKNIANTDKNLIATLGKLRRVPLTTIIKFFPELIQQLLEIYSLACDKHQLLSVYGSARETKFKSLAEAAFDCMVHLMDMTIARQNSYVFLFDQLMERALPHVGEFLVADLNRYLGSFAKEWNSTGRCICRVAVLVLRIAVVTVSDNASFVSTAAKFADNIAAFLKSPRDTYVSDQLIMIENLELILDTLRDSFDDLQLLRFIESWTTSMGLKGLGVLEEATANALINKKKSKEHRLVINKLFFLNRTLHSFLVDTESEKARELLFCNALSNALDVILSKIVDIDACRLALGVIHSAFSVSFGAEKRFFDPSMELYLTFARMFPTLANAFTRYIDYCTANKLLNPKRNFTQLFPTAYPFQTYTIDSGVQDEAFCEVLMEFNAVLIMNAQVSIAVNKKIESVFSFQEPAPAGYTALDGYIGQCMDHLNNEQNLVYTNNAMRAMVDPTYFPGPKWISLKAISICTMERYQEQFAGLILSFLPPPEKQAEDEFAKRAFGDYVISMLKCADSKPAAVEHLSAIAKSGCYKLTKGLRTRTAKSIGDMWSRLGREPTEGEVFDYGVTNFDGFQRYFLS
ncbi:unnamed protein product [Ambrosiozyma monospora]|uniref:Unnamed protein product n=1 Tax=Ambrosiozyma monospora TaxID=43982 RepID=A0ACB5SZB3_AMBMO|nr:unnamed protein product [Ambrosiozyma monospora]